MMKRFLIIFTILIIMGSAGVFAADVTASDLTVSVTGFGDETVSVPVQIILDTVMHLFQENFFFI